MSVPEDFVFAHGIDRGSPVPSGTMGLRLLFWIVNLSDPTVSAPVCCDVNAGKLPPSSLMRDCPKKYPTTPINGLIKKSGFTSKDLMVI
jgi:hypothetical protein